MKLLYRYLKNYWKLIALVLLLATINQVFSLTDPLILGIIIDRYVDHYEDFTLADYAKGVLLFIALAMGAAMISRIAKNFQDYFLSTVTQKLGAKIYTDGLAHSLELPYSVFED